MKRESFIEKSFCLCLINVPSTWYQLRMLELQRMLSAWFDMVIRQIWFFLFLRLRFDVFLCSIQGHSQLVKWFLKFAVTIKVFTYHVRVHLTSRREDKRLGPGLVPVVRTLDGAQQALRGASPAPPPERPRELAVQATIQFISVRETNCVIHWI